MLRHSAHVHYIFDIKCTIQKYCILVDSPRALTNTLWLNFVCHFGGRGRQEWVQLKWCDIELKRDSSGSEFLEFNERETKKRKGLAHRVVVPKLFSSPGK